jgi:acyl-homoserine-lactone acylase
MLLLFSLLACKTPLDDAADSAPDPYDVQIGPYEVDIRWTEYGIPHVLANDVGSAAYGHGYAFAQDHVCLLADQIVKVRSERASYHGRGDDDIHVNSDFGWLHIGVVRQAEDGFLSLTAEEQTALVGYAAGYSRFVSDGNLPSTCSEDPWIKPITHIDLLAYYLHLGEMGSAYVFADLFGAAEPPSTRRQAPEPPPASRLEDIKHLPIGSNGWALGKDRTAAGRGMLLSNTHFPSNGERQWHESHITVPGELNVYGASLMGVAAINLGFNDHISWTHTVSEAQRFTVYQLTLDSSDPTRYEYDGGFESMTPHEYSIDVKEEGSVERTLYSTRHGLVFNAPIIGWTPLNAFAMRDVNAGNLAMLPTWFAMNRATTLEEFKAAQRDNMGIPWVHTLAADDQGNAWYADSARTPLLTNDSEGLWKAFQEESAIAGVFAEYGVVVLDGGDPRTAWSEVDNRSYVAFDDAPQLLRSDYVYNANDNHWLSNPDAPLTGYHFMYGPDDEPRTPRTRMNAMFLAEVNGVSGDDHRFDFAELKAAAFAARGSMAELLLDDVITHCHSVKEPVTVEVDGAVHTVSLTEACLALEQFDGAEDLDAVGFAVWREFIGSDLWETEDWADGGRLFEIPFDPTDPIATPNGLAADPTVTEALAEAVVRLTDAGIPFDGVLGDYQFRQKGSVRTPVLGGPYKNGVISIATWMESDGDSSLLDRYEPHPRLHDRTGLTDEGYPINNGNSYVLVVEYDDDGPHAEAVLTYSQSEDPDSPHYSDQNELYGQGLFRAVRFTEDDIAADPTLVTLHLSL